MCLNTPGSYQCLEITHVPVACPNGFKYDSKVKQCLGKIQSTELNGILAAFKNSWNICSIYNRY